MENNEVQTNVVNDGCIAKSQFSVGGLIWGRIIAPIIAGIFLGILFGLLTGLCVIIPGVNLVLVPIMAVVDVVVGLAYGISCLIDLISFCCCHVKLTDKGLEGRADYFKGFDLSFDQIANLEINNKRLVINTNIPKNSSGKKMKKYALTNIKNRDEFYAAYTEQARKIAVEKTAETVSE
ncbi:MAG: hypothetical protein IJ011_02535 [Clostridia bacterium]|nr:hypothetical protein [Clostridia bacterium]